MIHPSRRKLALLLLVAFGLRLAAGFVWQSRIGDRFGMGDTESYWNLARSIAEGRPYVIPENHARVFRTPGYPVLLAPIFWLTDDHRTAVLLARAEAALFGTLAVLGVWWLARLLFDESTALLAAALATFYPGAIVLGALILSEAPFCPLMLLQLALWILAWKSLARDCPDFCVGKNGAVPFSGIFFAFCAGLAAGAATLMRPSWLLFTPFAAGVGIVLGVFQNCNENYGNNSTNSRRLTTSGNGDTRGNLFRHIVIAAWMLLGLVAAMAPWWIRNACITGRFVPTTLQVGASLYDGLSPEATGASNMDFVPRFEAEEDTSGDTSNEGHCSREQRLDRRMREASLAWASENPDRAVHLAFIKFLRMWNVWPNEPQLAGNKYISWGVFFTYTPLLIFAIIGACRTVRRGWPYLLCCLPAAYLTLLHVVFVSSIRYREPAMLALLALAAAGITGMKDVMGVKGEKSVEGLKE